MTGYETFCMYHSLKLHFTTDSYDYFKYMGKSKINVDAFEKRKDKYHFHKLSRKYERHDEMLLFLISNFVEKEDIWVGDLLSDESTINYEKHNKTFQSLSYIFENECRNVFGSENNPNVVLKTVGDYPPLLIKVLRQEISIETVCVLNMLLKFVPIWNKKITDNIRWPILKRRIEKFSPFLDINDTKYKLILKKVLT